MSEIPLCSIVISSQVPTAEIEPLETSLRMSSIQVQKSPSRVVGADDLVFVATVVGGIAATANLIEYGIKIAKALKKWRRELRSQFANSNLPILLKYFKFCLVIRSRRKQ